MKNIKTPFPPKNYMELVCGSVNNMTDLLGHTDDPKLIHILENAGEDLLENVFDWAGELVANMMQEEGLIDSSYDVLDVGCGCGRVARCLTTQPIASYSGFDRHRGMIEWCNNNIKKCNNHFSFYYFDLKSAYSLIDGEDGHITPASFVFPFDDQSFNSALLASVFTHMPFEESKRYLGELWRVLKPDGKILLSVFLSEDEPYTNNDVDFYYKKEDFTKTLTEAGFDYRFRELLYGHHWYALKKKQ